MEAFEFGKLQFLSICIRPKHVHFVFKVCSLVMWKLLKNRVLPCRGVWRVSKGSLSFLFTIDDHYLISTTYLMAVCFYLHVSLSRKQSHKKRRRKSHNETSDSMTGRTKRPAGCYSQETTGTWWWQVESSKPSSNSRSYVIRGKVYLPDVHST